MLMSISLWALIHIGAVPVTGLAPAFQGTSLATRGPENTSLIDKANEKPSSPLSAKCGTLPEWIAPFPAIPAGTMIGIGRGPQRMPRKWERSRMMTLWGRMSSTNVAKAVWAMDEAGLDYERIDAGLHFGVVDTPEFRKKNFNGLVPVLEVEGHILWESNAIVRFVSEYYAAGTLCPADPFDRAKAQMWMDWQTTTLWPSVVAGFWNLIRLPEDKRDQAAIAKSNQASAKMFSHLNDALEGNTYILGDAFSMGDIPIGVSAYKWSKLPWERPHLPHLEAWLGRLYERPAFDKNINVPLE